MSNVKKPKITLAESNPALASEWDYSKNGTLLPSDFTPGSSEKVWWHCSKCGHDWQSRIVKRKNGHGCPVCANRVVVRGINDFGTAMPALVEEWDFSLNTPHSPYDYTPFSNTRVHWICKKCGNKWKSAISSRSNGSQCPACTGNCVAVGINDLVATHPDIAAEWNYSKNGDKLPVNYSFGSHDKVWWKCSSCGHEWLAAINNRTGKNSGCPQCNNTHTSIPEKAVFYYLSQVFPDAIGSYTTEWLGKLEIDIYLPSLQIGIEYDGQAWHKASANDERKNALLSLHNVKLIRLREAGCAPLADNNSYNISVSPENDYSFLEQPISELFYYLQSFCNIDIPDISIHRDLLKIRALVLSANHENTLSATNPTLSEEWDKDKNFPLSPSNIKPNSHIEVWWRCKTCGNSWMASIASRNSGNGCTRCAQASKAQKLSKKVLCIETQEVYNGLQKAAEAAGVSISSMGQCCKGKSKTCGGLHWKYIE